MVKTSTKILPINKFVSEKLIDGDQTALWSHDVSRYCFIKSNLIKTKLNQNSVVIKMAHNPSSCLALLEPISCRYCEPF